MRANDISMGDTDQGGVLRWLIAWLVYQLAWLWSCYWWMWRVHMAARHGIPRSALEDPPADWLRVMQGPGARDR